MITSDEGNGDVQALWLSDEPAEAGLWMRMHAEHTRSGLWPLLARPSATLPGIQRAIARLTHEHRAPVGVGCSVGDGESARSP
ncbi:hypothetical protein ACFRCI_46545 [Streptomyces sp. NPDC056638]|uniref:hypothetical protein n=1 Tax=Streptomyces sp. NPDC056638 TaxID=3345887 RepID=UPI0036A824A6